MKTTHIDACPICSSDALVPDMQVTDIPYSGETYKIQVCQDCSFALTQDAPTEEYMGKYYNFDNYMSHADAAESVVDKLYHKVRDWMFVRKEKWIKACARWLSRHFPAWNWIFRQIHANPGF